MDKVKKTGFPTRFSEGAILCLTRVAKSVFQRKTSTIIYLLQDRVIGRVKLLFIFILVLGTSKESNLEDRMLAGGFQMQHSPRRTRVTPACLPRG